MQAIAVRHPDAAERFAAALLLPGQFLVGSATPDQRSRFFVQDPNAEGLKIAGPGAALDVRDSSDERLICDGRWKPPELDDEYRNRLHAADARHAHILGVLTASSGAAEWSR